ncbi:MAG: two component transcriptional regulator, LuxR family, partial [Thermoleophilia bacterium]|nr:two component transcriptional regulator, LuxR family [Thermoleophilia bacterium]
KCLRAEGISVPVVLLSAHSERGLLERAFDAGANGFVAKESDLEILIAALRTVMLGRRYVDPSVAANLLGTVGERLSPREVEVLGMVSVGLQNKEIAFKLSLSEETVKSHVAAIMRKLEATSRTQAVALALRTQLID